MSIKLTCVGCLVKTPMGEIKVENLKENDPIYVWEKNYGLVQDKVIKVTEQVEDCHLLYLFGRKETKIVDNQKIFSISNNFNKKICVESLVLESTSCSLRDINDSIIVGYFLGDGWLSSGYCGGIRKIKRCNISFGIHPNSDDIWIYEYINSKSSNKINTREKFIRSSQVPDGGISKKVEVTDRVFWEFLLSKGCPVGKKGGEIKLPSLSDSESKDFLTGIYSAEGCVYLGKTPSIQIAMNWKECIDYVSNILDNFNIFYTKHIYGKTHKIYISRIEDIIKCFSIFDFRLDSRKQAKYFSLIASIDHSIELHKDRISHIENLRKNRKNGMHLKQLMKIKPFNPRMLKENYYPKIFFQPIKAVNCNLGTYIPIKNILDLGKQVVIGIETELESSNIVVDKIILDGEP